MLCNLEEIATGKLSFIFLPTYTTYIGHLNHLIPYHLSLGFLLSNLFKHLTSVASNLSSRTLDNGPHLTVIDSVGNCRSKSFSYITFLPLSTINGDVNLIHWMWEGVVMVMVSRERLTWRECGTKSVRFTSCLYQRKHH